MATTERTMTLEEFLELPEDEPALEFEQFFRKLQALVADGRMSLPPKNFQSFVLISMLFVAHEREIRSANPPHSLMRIVAFFGKLLGYRL